MANDAQMPELLPCPFCGSGPTVSIQNASFSGVEAIALDVERRILAALTPAPTAQEAVPVGWSPETNILPWCALTIDQMRAFESSTGEIQRMGLNGEWIATDTPLSPGLIYRIHPMRALKGGEANG